MSRYKHILNKFDKIRILVVGDIILDCHIKGSVSRISPEAPVPVVLEEQRTETAGGAANVAHNLKALGAQVDLVGVLGDDQEGDTLKNILKHEVGIETAGIFTINDNYKTITKTRVMAQHQQVVRIDRETYRPLDDKTEIHDFVKDKIKDVDAVIISDYGKGLINQSLLAAINSKLKKHDRIIMVDPKVEHFHLYDAVTAITPNRKEAENAIRDLKFKKKGGDKLKIDFYQLQTDAQINQAGTELLRHLQLQALLITLGEHGMRLFEKGREDTPKYIPTHARDVYDVTGAGDAVISVFTLAYAAGASFKDAAVLANYAAGIVVGKLGAVAVKRSELTEIVQGLRS